MYNLDLLNFHEIKSILLLLLLHSLVMDASDLTTHTQYCDVCPLTVTHIENEYKTKCHIVANVGGLLFWQYLMNGNSLSKPLDNNVKKFLNIPA